MPINNINNNAEVMYMKINNVKTVNPQEVKQSEVRRKENLTPLAQGAPLQRQEAPQRVSDQVSLTTKRLVEEARARAKSMPEIRENKVAELKAKIESGTYQVSNRAIARAMVGTLLSEMA
jgi:negative regulator of flagellin synthesis FlgM